jgi:hypothetical protein
MTKQEIRDIVKKELKSVLTTELDKHIKKAISGKENKEEIADMIKKGLTAFARFLYVKRSVWENEI